MNISIDDTSVIPEEIDQNLPSYLSPYVYKIICLSHGKREKSCTLYHLSDPYVMDINQLLQAPAFQYPDENQEQLKDLNMRRVESIWNTIFSKNLSDEETSYSLAMLEWTGCAALIVECFMEAQTILLTNLVLLKVTAILEMSLGNVFTTIVKKKKCPALLNELLKTEELKMVFGEGIMAILQTLIGHPSSLNLRNVLWHGFPMAGEISSQYCYCLIQMVAALGKVIDEKKLHISHWKAMKIEQRDCLDVFPIIEKHQASVIKKLLKSTVFIPTGMRTYWNLAIDLYLDERYADAVITILPQIEHALRCLFTVVNNCPSRKLTAEASTLYTTFDEILAPHIDGDKENNLIQELGKNILEIISDLFTFPEGLRLRDRVSHGIYNFHDLDKLAANHVICIALCLCIKYIFPWRNFLTNTYLLKTLDETLAKYRSRFHPIALLKRDIKSCMDSIDDFLLIQNSRSDSNSNSEDTCHSISDKELLEISVNRYAEISSLYIFPIKNSIGTLKKEIENMHDMFKYFIHVVLELPWECLHRPRYELNIHRILRQIVFQCTEVIRKVQEALKSRTFLKDEKLLRTRARKNFASMLKVIPDMVLFCYLMLLVVSVESFTASNLALTPVESSKAIRCLKMYLKFSENVASLCSPQKNRWLDCLQFIILFIEHAEKRAKENIQLQSRHTINSKETT